MHRQKGFTLIEMMIVVAIIAVLAAIAIPNYQQYIIKSGRSEGQAKLLEAMQMQERFYSQNQTYTANLGTGGLAYSGVAANADAPSEDRRYLIRAAVCDAATAISSCVLLTATPQGGQASDAVCANLTLNSRGVKGTSGTGPVTTCW
ncbi:type IV pilin protein [Pseudomonas leptonychotis]|uniref:type IV pilin protein n=1 Tax=Pseudomonas leptonychotis TaxID=2448482 RepID=UPI0039F0BB91